MLLVKAKIGLLNRVDVSELFCMSKFCKGPRGTPSAISTPLGWPLLGPSSSPSHSTNCRVHFLPKADNAGYQLIESLWESEFLKGTAVLDTSTPKKIVWLCI